MPEITNSESFLPCPDCGNKDYIFIRQVWDGSGGRRLGVVCCRDCGRYEPVKLDYCFNTQEASNLAVKVWNNSVKKTLGKRMSCQK